MSNFIVKKVAVLGAGVMGAQIAAHCVNAKVPVVLFDLPAKDGDKNAIVTRAIENLKKLNPAPFGNKDDAQYIEVANYEDNLDVLAGCDLIIEAIAERMDWKHDLYKKVAPHIAPNAIFASNTSGLSITALAEGFDAELKARFCGVHFFNPPRYMHLVELIPTASTRPEILDQLEGFLTTTLGKGVVRAKDTPNFIANRVGIFGMLATIHEAEKFGLSVDVVDDLTGAKLGRAKSGTFRTADVVGLDTMGHVIKTMQDTLKDDPFYSVYATPPVLAKLIEGGALGQKAGAGFYKKVGKDILRLDTKTGEYVPGGGKASDLVARILKEKDPAKKLKAMRESTNPEAQFLWAIFRDAFHYIAVHMKDIADNARDVDFAMRWGFGWSVGPFETWQAAGWQQIATWIKEDIDAGKALSNAPLPSWVFDGAVAQSGQVHTPEGSFSASKNAYVPRSDLAVYGRQPFRASVLGDGGAKGATDGTTVFEDESVRIWHQNDDVLILSFKTKMHTIGAGVVAGMHKAVEEAEKNYKGLVIWHADAAEGGAFSAGADLQSMLPVF
ncbi:MAG TPA: 3-hydroxyacyl-CoA dehydrogenase NAD-binding domain-containing protein, partial [Burkholderiaceae bacterium]